MEEEVKEQIREMVKGLEERKDVQVVLYVYIAKIEAQQVVIETPEKP